MNAAFRKIVAALTLTSLSLAGQATARAAGVAVQPRSVTRSTVGPQKTVAPHYVVQNHSASPPTVIHHTQKLVLGHPSHPQPVLRLPPHAVVHKQPLRPTQSTAGTKPVHHKPEQHPTVLQETPKPQYPHPSTVRLRPTQASNVFSVWRRHVSHRSKRRRRD